MEKSLRAAWKAAHYPDQLGSLAKGLRASSIAGPNAFPFRSVRRLIASLKWWEAPAQNLGAYPSNTGVPQGPGAAWNDEVQGIAYDADYLYLVSTDAIWTVRRHELAPPKQIPSSQISIIDDDGLHYEGRRHLRNYDLNKETESGPKHLSAPSLYHGVLIVPAEGGVGADGQQWLWIFDPTTLGYLGRIGLDSVKSGLTYEISWCSADEESGLLYASRFTDAGHIAVFRLPPLHGLARVPADGLAVDTQFSYPTLYAEFVGGITMTESDGNSARLSQVQGGVISPSGHLYVAFQEKDRETVWGIVGYDPLTGRGIRYISLGFADGGHQWIQGITVAENQLRVLIWDYDIFSQNEYSVFHFGLTSPGESW